MSIVVPLASSSISLGWVWPGGLRARSSSPLKAVRALEVFSLIPGRLAGATAAAVGTYFLVNTWIVALAIALQRNQSVFSTWRTHFLHLGLVYAAGGYTALLLALFAPARGMLALLMLAPMPLVLYVSVRMWLGRINDRMTHLDTTNRQYRATIEVLAHAIDAKDQVTHGHIRRAISAGTRRRSGRSDERAASSHRSGEPADDLGKLAIPEHILNKPGRLSDAEYTTMKEHAKIGADILAGVDFPYPVVLIVRHHHENWDGTGYPDGSRAIRSRSALYPARG